MKKVIVSIIVFTNILLGENMLIEGISKLDVEKTSQKLQNILKAKNINIFTVIQHSHEAKKANLDMQDTQVVVFGAPKAGTPLMKCEPKIALELPLKILIYKNKEGKTVVAYEDLKSIAKRYNTKLCQEIVSKLSMAQGKIFKAVLGE